MASSSEFELLIATICNPASAITHRQHAESRLLETFSNPSTCFNYLSLILTASDNVCFFIGIGLQRLVWRHWDNIDDHQKQMTLDAIREVLLKRHVNLQSFSKSKLEQVLAAICIQSKSFDPIMEFIRPHIGSNQITQETIIGLSVVRTSLDLILSENPKISTKDRSAIVQIIERNGLVVSLTNLACTVCATAMQNYNPATLQSMVISLEFLKIIVSKLPLGSHISIDVLMLLFTLAESGSDVQSNIHQCALTSIEILSEVMTKKYVPTGGVPILLQIVDKTVSLLRMFRENGCIDDSPIVLNLLEFITIFSDAQLERCASFTYGVVGNGKPDIMKLQKSIADFFNELVSITIISKDPEVLYKIVAVWNRIMNLDNVKIMVLENMQALIVPILTHLIQACLTQSNSHMAESIDDLVEDLKVDILVDPHVKEILVNVNAIGPNSQQNKKNDDDLLGVEECIFIGSSLITETHDLIAEITITNEVKQWLQPVIQQLVGQTIQIILSPSTNALNLKKAVVDMLFLLRLLPISTYGSDIASIDLACKILDFTTNMIESSVADVATRTRFQQKEFIVLQLHCFQIIGQLIPKVVNANSSGTKPSSSSTDIKWLEFLQYGLKVLMSQISSKLNFNEGALNGGSFGSLILAMTILIMQIIISLQNSFLSESLRGLQQELLGMLVPCCQYSQSHPRLLEVHVLLLCCQDMLQSSSCGSEINISHLLSNQLSELLPILSSISMGNDWSPLEAHMSGLLRVLASLDALTRHHNISTATRRQVYLTSISALQASIPTLSNLIMNIQHQLWKYYVVSRYAVVPTEPIACGVSNSLVESTARCCSILISMGSALVQSLGKRSFGKVAFEVLAVCVSFVESCSSLSAFYTANVANIQSSLVLSIHNINPSNGLALVLFDHMGCRFLGSVLDLARILAESTAATATTTNSQIEVTYRLLITIMRYFSDERICGELLQLTLKTGIAATRCYWARPQKLTLPTSTLSPQSATQSTPPLAAGENVRELVQSLVQLCVGSLGSNVPPQDTLLALEGMLSLKEQHNIFSIDWFQQDCWNMLFPPCLKAIVLHMHNSHYTQLESVFLSLCDAKIQLVQKTHHESANGMLLEFWSNVCQDIIKIANEYNCGAKCHAAIVSAMNQLNSSTGNNKQTLLSDSAVCLKEVILPAAAIISQQS